jgi:hypothetical protein
MDVSDLAAHEANWVEPIHMDYKGYRLHEIPPSGQGIGALKRHEPLDAQLIAFVVIRRFKSDGEIISFIFFKRQITVGHNTASATQIRADLHVAVTIKIFIVLTQIPQYDFDDLFFGYLFGHILELGVDL